MLAQPGRGKITPNRRAASVPVLVNCQGVTTSDGTTYCIPSPNTIEMYPGSADLP